MEKVMRWWCRWFHVGIVNVNAETYECRECLRVYSHNLPRTIRAK